MENIRRWRSPKKVALRYQTPRPGRPRVTHRCYHAIRRDRTNLESDPTMNEHVLPDSKRKDVSATWPCHSRG
jgi:hypothetical protein